jgi:hypothetical protein
MSERHRTNLDWAIALAHHLQPDALAAVVQSNPFVLHWQNSTWHLLGEVIVRVRVWERIRRWNGKEAAIQRFLQIAVIAADGMVDCHEVCACGEGSFDLELDESMYDGGKDMATAEHGFADGHEVGHRVEAIANQLRRVSTMISSIQLRFGIYLLKIR